MALRVGSPWWLSAVLLAGLFFLFMGQRAFSHTDLAAMLSWLGCILVAGSLGARAWVLMQARGAQRRIEIISILSSVGVLVALLLYYLTTKSGMSLLGMKDPAFVERWQLVMTPLWLIVLTASLVPLLLIETSLGLARRASFRREDAGPDASVDVYRVREMASSGLSIALAAAFLMVTCNIADQRNMRKDVSYFKTSSPGSATTNMVKSMSQPLQVLLFFPENSEVLTEVHNYFKVLSSSTGNLNVEVRDRLIDSAIAKEHKVSRDGVVLLLNGDKSEQFSVETDITRARKKILREFDGEFQKSLMAVMRAPKVAYFSTGHGELNDPAADKGGDIALNQSQILKLQLKKLNYLVKDYKGFGAPVPADCSLLFVLAPRSGLLDEDLQAIDDYLAQGGAAIISFDPDSKMKMGVLAGRLGVEFNPAPIADEKEFMQRSRSDSDHSLILSNQFLSHASIATLSQGSARSAMLFVKPGSFDEVPFSEERADRKRTHVVRSMSSSFRDVADALGNQNYIFDRGTEKRDRYPLITVVEDPSAKPAKAAEGVTSNGMRVVLVADYELFSDGIVARLPVVQFLLDDLVKWTGGEEVYAGETISEKDMRIEHTKSKDAIWFWGTMAGAPMLMLGIGLLVIGRRRHRAQGSQQ